MNARTAIPATRAEGEEEYKEEKGEGEEDES
jgi:hypothetical protein